MHPGQVTNTFTCPACTDTYQLHWRDPNSLIGWCKGCGPCKFPVHPHDAYPCSGPLEQPGEPCRWCGKLLPAEAEWCPDCAIPFEGMSLADIKAVFAADGTFSVGGLGPQL